MLCSKKLLTARLPNSTIWIPSALGTHTLSPRRGRSLSRHGNIEFCQLARCASAVRIRIQSNGSLSDASSCHLLATGTFSSLGCYLSLGLEISAHLAAH